MTASGRRSKKPRAPVSGPLLILLLASLATMALLVLAYQRSKVPTRTYSARGLDINAEVPKETQTPAEAPAGTAPTAAPSVPQGGLSMVRGGADARLGEKSVSRKESAAATITRLVRINEVRYQKVAERFSAQSPTLRQYGKDWMSYPDLKRYNDEYFKDHDPIKFGWSVARSPNFAALVKKYAGQKVFLNVLAEFARQTPTELANAGRAYLEADHNAATLVKKFATAIGLPGEIFAGIAEGKVDPNQGMNAAISQNPALQQFLQQSNIDPSRINAGFNR